MSVVEANGFANSIVFATAAPLADRYARWYASHPRDQLPPMESVDVAAHRIRGPGLAGEHGAP